jgi:hypothetical protein
MTSRLAIFRVRLNGLRTARAVYRAVAAWSALGASIIVSLLVVFALDFTFGLSVIERMVVLTLAIAAIGWAFWRFTRPLIGRGESELEMALLVERQHQIDTDLVAALQFESSESSLWGSPQLKDAIIDYVAAAMPTIDVFRDFDRGQFTRRVGLFFACLAVVLLVSALAPRHVTAFGNRLCLGSMHYPTWTRIERIFVNRTVVVASGDSAAAPADCRAAQGRPLVFLVQCNGHLPSTGRVVLTADNSTNIRTQLELRPLSLAERLARLQEAAGRLNDVLRTGALQMPLNLQSEVRWLVSFDAPRAVSPLLAAHETKDLTAAAAEIAAIIDNWPADRESSAVFAGELARLNDDVKFRIVAGDAWTEPARVQMIPLPVIETKLSAKPPKYAADRMKKVPSATGQLAVPEGSSVDVTVESVNHKPLASAWMTIQNADGPQRIDLAPQDAQRLNWSLTAGDLPFRDIRRELRYEIQVLDLDGLSLEAPIRGTIRIRPDEPPTIVVDVLHKLVLPTAEPVVRYRATDDYGISNIALLVSVERNAAKPASSSANGDLHVDSGLPAPPAIAAPVELHRFELHAPNEPLFGERLPVAGNFPLSLSPLKLAKGDSLKLTLEVTDYRGENDHGQPIGQAAISDSLVLQVSDESGVLAAISEGDQRSEQQLSEIIKRQLGIGDQPQ